MEMSAVSFLVETNHLESGVSDHLTVPVGAALGDARLALVVDIDNAEAL